MTLRFARADLRAELIAAGAIRPGDARSPATPLRLPPGMPVLRLDAAGRAAARRHIAEGPLDGPDIAIRPRNGRKRS